MNCKITRNAAKVLRLELDKPENAELTLKVFVTHSHGDHAHYGMDLAKPTEQDEVVTTDKDIDVILTKDDSFLDGVKIDDNQLALDAFREVGPGNHFFGSQHTLANYETAFWDSEIADNENYEKWEAAGSQDAAVRANRRWKKVLADYVEPPLDQGIDDELKDFIGRKKAGMQDSWY